ncbi:Bug family tripartite tricarboxylate transporter substrate binding protein [Phreatobacter sp. AB_2022a]|uniref:Bug family tripartite tricarboxylate transporter substrate binding protein n=1 Tax=Phreatobacter sp. AB_2022a TaxID=3003134 RepID=UPI002286DD58|nr:tripartite tricarboxylate transporter substrate binding protein [Phreatobacter sp. AB_2022a]MCZ0733027.1 tripartite tricarboxylate transporter substrate binding protein [Phreatobacter sp. AB_2022a]
MGPEDVMGERELVLSRRGLGALALAGLAGPAFAQGFPSRPIQVIVPFAAGGGVDVTMRVAAEAAGDLIGQRFVVENRGGGATITATTAVVRAAPDGYTVLTAPTTMVINAASRDNLPFDWKTDLVPVSMIAKLPLVVVARRDAPYSTMRELEAAARAARDPLTFSSGGTGTVAHLAGELFALRTGIKLQHVPYRGEGPALSDLIGGTLKVSFATLASVSGQIEGGTVKALGVTTKDRTGLLPGVPTLVEQGYPDYDVSAWLALVAPRGTPQEAIDAMQRAFAAALATQSVRDRMKVLGAEPVPGTPAELAAFMAKEAAQWAEVVRAIGLKPE